MKRKVEQQHSDSAQQLAEVIVKGVQEKKGRGIVLLDMRKLHDAICDYMIIAEANTPTQLQAIEESVSDFTRDQLGERPLYKHDGDGSWIALDYISVIIHLMTPEMREYYKIEQLWEDAGMERIPDLD